MHISALHITALIIATKTQQSPIELTAQTLRLLNIAIVLSGGDTADNACRSGISYRLETWQLRHHARHPAAAATCAIGTAFRSAVQLARSAARWTGLSGKRGALEACLWTNASKVFKQQQSFIWWRRRPYTRTRASVTEAPAQEPHNTEFIETDLHKKCLQAAIDLQEHGWAVVEDVLTQYVTHKASLLANASFVY